ncbi:uncharacterized protein LOC108676956 [Hyalella azteca]|uniref:Uncharacterized protein LOC108676956 n=1 Tax=Hyalella azteca TaxID=294128 RepID=A0A8B7P3R7_HYAAZ|nr:uncharacterized protein LOC108676956 [Hyalella azteca]
MKICRESLRCLLVVVAATEAVVITIRGAETEVQVRGLAVNNSAPHQKLSAKTLCQCRQACRAWPPCLSFSYKAASSECRLLVGDRLTNTEEDPDAVYHYRYTAISSVPSAVLSKDIVRLADGLYYFYQTTTNLYSAAKNVCEEWPGFHLPVIITQTQHTAIVGSSFYKKLGPFHLGLSGIASTGYTWANGMDFTKTTKVNFGKTVIENDDYPNKHYHMWDGDFCDCPNDWNQAVYCQANLDQIPWN